MSETDYGSKCYAVWETAWGAMGAVAGDSGLRRMILPYYRSDEVEEMLVREHPHAVKNERPFRRIIELTRAYLGARPVDFRDVVCDLPPEDSFSGKVYRACREIPYGATVSYSDLAGRIHRPKAPRAVASAMSRNPIPLIVPCHRVIYCNGGIGGFSAPGGLDLKRRMLDLEKNALTLAESPDR